MKVENKGAVEIEVQGLKIDVALRRPDQSDCDSLRLIETAGRNVSTCGVIGRRSVGPEWSDYCSGSAGGAGNSASHNQTSFFGLQ